MTRWLRHKTDGTLYEWDSILDKNPKVEEVTEQEAFPEKFVSPGAVEAIAKRRGRQRKTLDSLAEFVSEPPPYSNPELNAEATRRFK